MERITGVEQWNATEERLHGLFTRALSGDSAAYHAFLAALSPHLRAFLRRRLVDLPNDVEDLVQETLLAVHNQRQTYDPAQPVTAWVHAIAKYKMVDLLRRRAHREALTDSLDDGMELLADSASQSDATDVQRDLGRLLEQLPDKQRLPIIHVKLEGRSVVETMALTGLSESAVKVGVHRGLKALAALIRGK